MINVMINVMINALNKSNKILKIFVAFVQYTSENWNEKSQNIELMTDKIS